MSMDRSRIEAGFDLFWPDRVGACLGFSAGPDQSRIVRSRVCQLKYAMSYVRTPLSFKSKRRIELLIYNPFQTMISQSPQFHKSLRLAVRDDTVIAFFT